MMKVNRRDFVYTLSALVVAPPIRLFGQTPQSTPLGPLTDLEKNTLAAICEQIIPADDDPGARELGVVEFIDRLLREAHPDWIRVYRHGISALDQNCRELHQKSFQELGFDEQTEVLRKMERGDLALTIWAAFPPEEFFGMVRSHTMQGYYGHPQWGGNKDKLAWKMIGYDDWWV